jgi:hypothetical protein
LSFEQAAPLVLHLPALGQFAFVLQRVSSSVHRPLPHCALAVHNKALLLQWPGVRHWVSLMQVKPFFPPAPVHLPLTCGHWVVNVQDFEVHSPLPMPLQSESLVHTVVLFGQVLVWHSPPVNGHWAALWHTVEPLLHRPSVAVQVVDARHCRPAGLAQVPGQS